MPVWKKILTRTASRTKVQIKWNFTACTRLVRCVSGLSTTTDWELLTKTTVFPTWPIPLLVKAAPGWGELGPRFSSKIWIKPLKEINLGVVRALFDALKIRLSRCFDSYLDARRRASRHFHMGLTPPPPPGVGIRLYLIMIICDNNYWLYLHDLLNYIQYFKRFCKLNQ